MSARAAAVLLPLLLACSALPRSPRPAPEEGDWPRVRDAQTRREKVYDRLAVEAFASATRETPEVRAARVARTAAWKAMTPDERAALQAEEDAAAAKYEEFTVSLFTPDRNDNDLDSPKTAWRIALVVPGGPELLATDVDTLRPDALLRTLYPNVGDFDIVYRVRFERPPGPSPAAVVLRLAGPRARVDFDFGVPPPGPVDPHRAPGLKTVPRY
jgi:hypothetical protein